LIAELVKDGRLELSDGVDRVLGYVVVYKGVVYNFGVEMLRCLATTLNKKGGLVFINVGWFLEPRDKYLSGIN
jgi:hypothetical protein